MALQVTGEVDIAYYDRENDQLKYATNASGSWITEPVANGGKEKSVLIDQNGNAHIFYSDLAIYHAFKSAGSWATEPLTNDGWGGENLSSVLDENNIVHIIYSANDALWYLTTPLP